MCYGGQLRSFLNLRLVANASSLSHGCLAGQAQPHPTPRLHGRGPHRPVLPHRRGESVGGGSEEALGRAGLHKRGVDGGFGRGRHPLEHRTIRAATRSKAAIEIAISSLKRVFGLGETLATTLVGLATRIAAKICAYTYAFMVNRMLGRPQGHIKELWA